MIRHIAHGSLGRVLTLGAMMVLFSLGPIGAVAAHQTSTPAPITVQLNEIDNSNISGTATLTAKGNQTVVDMKLTGSGLKGNHPTHIHTGTCANFDPNPLYPLETVVLQPVNKTGLSDSTVDVPLSKLQSADYVILVHESPTALTHYLVCGEIPRIAVATATQEAFPVTGAGIEAVTGSGIGTAMVLGLGVIAGLSLLAGLGVRRRPGR